MFNTISSQVHILDEYMHQTSHNKGGYYTSGLDYLKES